MTALVRAQFVSLRTLRSSWVVPGVLIAVVALFVFASLDKVGEKRDLMTASQLREAVMSSIGLLTAVTLAVFAALHVAGEYRHDTITQRVLASPRRGRILGAQLVTYSLLGLVVVGVTLGIGVAIGEARISGKELSLGLSAGVIGGAVLAVVLFTLLGAITGAILRSQPAAVAAVIGVFLAEQLFAALTKDVGNYLPYALLNPLLGLDGAEISRAAAALTLTGITAGLGIVAYVLLQRRDIA